MKLRVISTVGQNTPLTVKDEVFGVKVNPTLIAQAVRVYLSNQRQGTSKVKTRSEVARTKKKWFKQKGTGNARHGARTANLFVGGGVAHGPTGTQNWTLKLSNSLRKKALATALSAQAENIVVCDDFNQLDGKTASAHKMLTKMLPDAKRVLVILANSNDLALRSLRNIDKVIVSQAYRVNTYEVALADAIIMTKEAVKLVEDRLTAEPKTKVKAPKAEAVKVKEVKEVKEVKVKPVAKAKVAKPAVKKAAPKKAAAKKSK